MDFRLNVFLIAALASVVFLALAQAKHKGDKCPLNDSSLDQMCHLEDAGEDISNFATTDHVMPPTHPEGFTAKVPCKHPKVLSKDRRCILLRTKKP